MKRLICISVLCAAFAVGPATAAGLAPIGTVSVSHSRDFGYDFAYPTYTSLVGAESLTVGGSANLKVATFTTSKGLILTSDAECTQKPLQKRVVTCYTPGAGSGMTPTAHGGGGDDRIAMSTGARIWMIATGDEGNDVLSGGLFADQLFGGNGNDVVSGGDDDDSLFGDSGADRLLGGPGNDFMNAGAGADLLIGGDGREYMLGLTGVDQLYGGEGDDFLGANDGEIDAAVDCGPGNDTAISDLGDPTVDCENILVDE